MISSKLAQSNLNEAIGMNELNRIISKIYLNQVISAKWSAPKGLNQVIKKQLFGVARCCHQIATHRS